MRKTLRILTAVAAPPLLALSASGQFVINEIDADTNGSDRAEFIELAGTANASLDGFIVVLFNGGDNKSYRAIDLAGHTTDSDGLFVIGSTGMPGVDIQIAPGSSGWMQNGAEAVAIYQDLASNFPNDTALTSTNLIDALVYGVNDFTDFTLVDALTPGEIQVDEDGNESSDSESIQRQPDGGSAFDIDRFTLGTPSPGALNNPDAELNFSFSAMTVAEDAGDAGEITATIFQDGDLNVPVVVTITNSDPSELMMPAEVTIPGDGTGETTFTITPLDDGAADGTISVNILGTSPGFFDAVGSIDVTDDSDPASLVINEVNAAVLEGRDANKNGLTDHQGDEFIELVNISGDSLDISGWTITDDDGESHVFPAGTELHTDCAVVVFGGGSFAEGILPTFGNALVQKASNGALNFNNSGDSIFIREGAIERAGFAYDDVNGFDGSQTRDPDVTGSFVGHLAAGGGTPFSPGTTSSGVPFCTVDDSLTVTVSGATAFLESAGANASMLTITRSGPTEFALEVSISVSDGSELSAQSTAMIPIDEPSVSIPIDAVDDAFVDGDQQVTLSANAGSGFISGSASVTVEDAGDDSNYILINEVDVDPPGSDVAEFIELYDGGVGNTPLDGYVLVLYNGDNDTGSDNVAYEQFDLDDYSTNADGFFVLGSIGVPNVDLDVFPISGGWITTSGTRALALYSADASAFLDGTSPTDTDLVDAVIYGADDKATVLVAAFGTPSSVLSKDSSSMTISRLPDGSGGRLVFIGFGDGIPTPGTANRSESDPSPYQIWATSFPLSGGPDADDDFDGIPNAIAFALGLNPLVPDGGALPEPFVNGSGNLQITVTKSAEASSSTFFASTSFDGANWSDTDLNIITDDATTFAAEYTGSEPTVLMRWGINVAP